MYIFFLFALFYFFCILFEQTDNKNKTLFLALSCFIFALISGLRSIYWPDTIVYVYTFENSPSLLDLTSSDKPQGFSEKGFWAIGLITKLFTEDYQIYLCIVSLITFLFLFKDLKLYSLYPLIGLCTYISRFYYGRNFMQIRAGVCYAILLLGIKYLQEKDWKKYFLIVFIAWLFHRSAIVAIPLYFIYTFIKIKPWHIIIALIGAFIIGIAGQGIIHNFIEDNASDLTIGTRYTYAGGEQRQLIGSGIMNPMIYFQTLILLAYTFLEKRIAPLSKYYYSIRTAYLYSTIILICFCSYKVLSARTSTIFATLEFSIIPSLIYLFNKKNRFFAFLVMGAILIAIFYMNFNSRV